MEPQSPQPPRTPRGGSKERYEAEESAQGLIAGLVGLDCADIIRRSTRGSCPTRSRRGRVPGAA